MTSGNDKKGPPPAAKRPAPPVAPQRPAAPAGPTTGGSAARPAAPAPRPAAPAAAAPRPGAPTPPRPAAPAPRPAPSFSADADDKTSAINLADLGLEDDATVSVDSSAIKAKAAAMAAHEPADEERTTAFNVADLPPEDDEPKRAPQKTLLGHPAPKPAAPGAAVRGGAAPVRRNETLALGPSMGRPAPSFDEEKTSALSLDDIHKIDALPAKHAPAKAAPAPHFDEEKTSALSLDDIDKIDALPAKPAAKPAAKPVPAKIEENERTMAVSLDDIDLIDAAPAKKAPAAAKAAAHAPAPKAALQDEKTTAMSLDDIDQIDAGLPRRKTEAPVAAAPARAKAVAGTGKGPAMSSGEGFAGSIAYALQHDAVAEKAKTGKGGQAKLDPSKKAAGLRNLIIAGGVIAALMVVIGIIW